MMHLFGAITDRLKALFIATVGLDFEAQLLTRDAERKADLLRQAARYEEEGLNGIAQHLRQQAETISLQRPLASVLPATEYLLAGNRDTATPAPQIETHANGKAPDTTASKQLPRPTRKTKGR